MIAQIVRQQDALLETINAYRQAWSAVLAIKDEKEAGKLEHLWLRHFERLKEWDKPAATRQGAVAAMQFAYELYDLGDTPVIPAMMKAALAYFNGLEQENANTWQPLGDVVSKLVEETAVRKQALLDAARIATEESQTYFSGTGSTTSGAHTAHIAAKNIASRLTRLAEECAW